MARFAVRGTIAVLAVSASVTCVAATASTSDAAARCGWQRTKAAAPFTSDVLRGVYALNKKTVWAVGSSNATGHTLVERLKHNKFVRVKSPNKSTFTELEAVTTTSKKYAWAVGYYFPKNGGHARTLIERWNGHKWKVVKSPNPLSRTDNFLWGVTAIGPRNVWAVGDNNLDSGVGDKGMILHYSHGKWRNKTPSGLPGGLSDVSAVSARDVTAVGHDGVAGDTTPLIEHFNGASWTRKSVVTSGTTGQVLYSASTPSASAHWAAGLQSGSSALQTLSDRDAGSGFAQVNPANVSTTQPNILYGIAATSKSAAWAVGRHDAASTLTQRVLAEHYTGGSWAIDSPKSVNSHATLLYDVASTTNRNVWAVGYYSDRLNLTHPLVEHFHC
jgi:hypothetical protein